MGAAGIPSLGLSLGISPYSDASTGLDMFGDGGSPSIGGVSFGTPGTPVSGLVRDGATVVVVALAAAWVYKKWVA